MMMLTIVAKEKKNKRRIIFMNSPTVTRGVRKTLNLLSKSQKSRLRLRQQRELNSGFLSVC